MDGNGTLFGNVQGNSREIIHKFSVDLPKKHGRGGQVMMLWWWWCDDDLTIFSPHLCIFSPSVCSSICEIKIGKKTQLPEVFEINYGPYFHHISPLIYMLKWWDLRKVCEMSIQFFISNNMPNVSGLILAGENDDEDDDDDDDVIWPDYTILWPYYDHIMTILWPFSTGFSLVFFFQGLPSSKMSCNLPIYSMAGWEMWCSRSKYGVNVV